MDPIPEPATPPSDDHWKARQADWQRRLPRLRFHAEPIVDQLMRCRRATYVLTWVTCGIGLGIVSLFTAFRRPDVGAVLASVLFAPILLSAWYEDTRLQRRAAAYLRELKAHEQDH